MIRTLGAFLRRDLRIAASYNLSFVLEILGIFPLVLMFFFLARLFGDIAAGPLRAYGGAYFPFVLIGIAVQNYFSAALRSFAAGIREAQVAGTLEAVLATPLSPGVFLFGTALYAFVFNALRIFLYLIAGGLLAGMVFDLQNMPAALFVLVLSIAAFSSMGILSAAFILFFKKGDPLNWFFSVLSWLLGGVYYPVSVLPEWLRTLAGFIPMTHTLEALRILLLGQGTLGDVSGHLAALAAWAAIGLPAGYGFFLLALGRARRDGTIGHY